MYKKPNILICTYEYYPKGSGIANVVYYIVKNLKAKHYNCKVLSSGSGDIDLNYESQIKKYSGIGLLMFWNAANKYIANHEKEYDLIWVHNPLFARKVYSSKVYCTVHTTYVNYFNIYKNLNFSLGIKAYYLMMRLLEQCCYSKNKFRSSVVSPPVKKELVELGIDPTCVKYVPNGVDTKKFFPSKIRKSRSNDNFTLLCVGRVSYQKNPLELVKTMHELQELGSNVKLVWAGDGELLEQISTYIKDNSISNIRMLGRVNHDKLPLLYQSADAYILASLYEGQPLTILEAMSSGLPCIVANIPNMADLVKQSNCGRVIDFSKKLLRAKNIISYLKSDKFQKDKQIIRDYTVRNMDWKIITEKYLAEWENIIDNKKKNSAL